MFGQLVKIIVVFFGLTTCFALSAGAAGRPAAPTHLTATALSPTEIKLLWKDNSTDETGFRIERATDGVTFEELGSVALDVRSFIDTTVSGDALFTYRVIATGATHDSSPSNVVSQYTVDTVPPSAPILSSPDRGDTLDTRHVRFQWKPVEDISGVTYHIVVFDLGSGATIQEKDGIRGTSIEFLLFDSIYGWFVTATDGAGNVGPESETWYFLVLDIDTAPPDLSITTPNGGEELVGGSYYTITWYALDDLTSTPDLKIKLYFSPNAGADWQEIVSLQHNPGAFRWHVPNISSDLCLVRVTATDESQKVGLDTSDAVFTIIPQPVTVTNPTGGESWKRGSTHFITWTSTMEGGTVSIKLFDGKTFIGMITTRTPNDAAFRWTIPADLPPGRQYRVKVTYLDADPRVSDICDSYFGIE